MHISCSPRLQSDMIINQWLRPSHKSHAVALSCPGATATMSRAPALRLLQCICLLVYALNYKMQSYANSVESGLTTTITHMWNMNTIDMESLFTQDRGTSLASNQVQYSLLYRAPETNGVKQACEEGGTSLIAYSPLAQGLLTGQTNHIASIRFLVFSYCWHDCHVHCPADHDCWGWLVPWADDLLDCLLESKSTGWCTY